MKNERKSELVAKIKAAYPYLEVRTRGSLGDFDLFGIAIRVQDRTTGQTLYSDLDDADLDGMTDAGVLEWVASTVASHESRKKGTRRAKAVERQMDRE